MKNESKEEIKIEPEGAYMKFLVVIESKTNTVVKKVDITDFLELQVDRLDLGICRNMSLGHKTRIVTAEQLEQMKQA